MVACPFRTLVVQYLMFTFIMCLILLMSGHCFYIYPHPQDVSAHGHSVLNNGFDNSKRATFILDLHTKLSIISRGILGFATGSPCDVWSRG